MARVIIGYVWILVPILFAIQLNLYNFTAMNLPFKTLILLSRKSTVPLYLQLSNKLIELISQGKILPGAFLPATREMATLLNIHRKTVIQAYEELEIQGWIEPVFRKGYRVLLDLPITKPRSFKPKDHFLLNTSAIDDAVAKVSAFPFPENESYNSTSIIIDDGFPDIRLSPYEQFHQQYKLILRDELPKSLMLENNEGGQLHLRESISSFLNHSRGLNIGSDHLMVTRGAQMAIFIAAALLIKPGDKVLVSEPNYFMADHIFQKMGAVLYRVPVDEEGMDVNYLESLLKKESFKLLYIIPHHHHPTTVTMSPNRRANLLHLVQLHDLWVVEDDYDYDFHYQNSPILPLASAAHHGKIVYIGSYTKLLGASFRIGYMVAGKQLIKQAMSYRRLMDIRGDFMMEEALARLIDNGEIERHINKSIKQYAKRFKMTAELLQSELGDFAMFKLPQGGMAIWLQLNQKYPLQKIIQRVKNRNLFLQGSAYHQKHHPDLNSIRFGFASLDAAGLTAAISILKETLKKLGV